MNHEKIKQLLISAGTEVCNRVFSALRSQSIENLSNVFKEGLDDTIYQIDRDVEEVIVPIFEAFAEELGGIVLLAEGIGDPKEGVVLPMGSSASDTALRIIVDPIDGTRGIMYDKRSAFFLAAVAPNKGKNTKLSDIEVAVMVELPTSRAAWSDTLSAIKGQGTQAQSRNLYTEEVITKRIQPSKAKSILGGFGQIARFFPPGRELLARIDDELVATLFPNPPAGKTLVFEDQYISTGGQLYEILMGHDRYIGDIRTLLNKWLVKNGQIAGHICHPYDACCMLIGVEAGVIVTDAFNQPFDAPMDLLSDVDFIMYANSHIYKQVQPVLQNLLLKHGLLIH